MHGSGGLGWNLSLVVPAYNEADGIANAIIEADDTLASIAKDYEVLVVDDGSSDSTFSIAQSLAAARLKVRVIRHEQNRGYGAALRTGFEAARFENVAFTDADCQFDLRDLDRMVPLAEDVPIVAGYRIDRKDIWRRRFLSKGYNLIVRTLLGTRVRDCDCALKVFRKDALQHILPKSHNYFVNTEMLTRARQRSYAIAEVGVTHRPRLHGESKVSMSDVPKTLATLLPFWWTRQMFAGPTQKSRAEKDSWSQLAIVMVFAALMFFSRLGTPLLEPEEVRYAEIPRQMHQENRWLVPALHGQPYLDKPPLMYWMVMTSYRVFGIHDWAARVVPGICGWLTVMIVYFWARRTVSARAAFLSAIVLCLSAQFIYYGRMLTMNAPLALFVTAALASAHVATTVERRRNAIIWWVFCGVALGLGALTKGPVAFALVLPPLFVWLRLESRARRPGLVGWLMMALAALVVALPWYALVTARHPEFTGYFFWFHNVKRFAQPFDHEGPIWQYILPLLAGNLPWTLLLVPLAILMLRRSYRSTQRRPAALGMILLTFGWSVMFFSIAGSKRPVYIVPALPALALAIGIGLNAMLPQRPGASVWAILRRYRSRLAWYATAGMIVSGIAIGLVAVNGTDVPPARGWWLTLASLLLLPVFLIGTTQRRASWLLVGAASAIVALFGVQELLPAYAQRNSMRHLVHMNAWRMPSKDGAIYCYPHRFESLGFYGQRTDVRSYGRNERQSLFDVMDEGSRSLLIVQTKHLREIVGERPPTLEYTQHQSEPNVTVLEVRRRRAAPSWIVRAD
jgi:dolichol-phosphate mannosyltransferase